MHILVITYEYPPIGGGGGIAAAGVINHLRNDRITVITAHEKLKLSVEHQNNVRIIRTPTIGRKNKYSSSLLSLISNFLFSLLLIPYLRVKTGRYDVLHAHFAIPSGLFALIFDGFKKTKKVLTVYAGDIFGSDSEDAAVLSNPLFRIVSRLAGFVTNRFDKIATISEDSKNLMIKYLNITKREIKVIPLGVDLAAPSENIRKGFDISPSDCLMTSICRLVHRKRIKDVILALNVLKPDNFRYLILGDGPEKAHLQELIEKLQLGDMIQIIGYVSNNEKADYLYASDIFIMPSSHEGFGISYLEAMAAGLPIVASNQGGHTEFLKNNINGFLVPVGDIQQLAGAVSRLIADGALRKNMGRKNKKLAEKFSWNAIANTYKSLCCEAMANGADKSLGA